MSWPIVPLSEVCDLHNGYAFKSKDYVKNSGTLSCRMSNIRPDGSFDLSHNPKYLPDIYAQIYNKYLLQDNDIVIAMTDMANDPKILGVPTIVNRMGMNLLLNQRVGKLIIKDSQKVFIPYLKYALSQKRVKNYYKKFAGGGLQINLGKKDLLSVKLPIPPLPEQKRIAAILDKADALREKRRQAIAKLYEMVRSVFLDMFGDPSTNSTWERISVEQLASSRIGSIRTGPFGSQLLHSEFVDKGVAVLGIDNAVRNEFSWDKRRYITNAKYRALKRYKVYPGDVIITIMGTCGRCAIVPKEIPDAINTKHLCCITLNMEVCLPEYLHGCFLMHPEVLRQLGVSSKGAVMPGLNMQIIKHLIIPIAPLPKQKKYADLYHSIKQQIQKHKDLLMRNDELFSSLQQSAFKGEL